MLRYRVGLGAAAAACPKGYTVGTDPMYPCVDAHGGTFTAAIAWEGSGPDPANPLNSVCDPSYFYDGSTGTARCVSAAGVAVSVGTDTLDPTCTPGTHADPSGKNQCCDDVTLVCGPTVGSVPCPDGYARTTASTCGVPTVRAGQDIGPIALEQVSAPKGTMITALGGVMRGIVRSDGVVAWDWYISTDPPCSSGGEPTFNCDKSSSVGDNRYALRSAWQRAGFWADGDGYCTHAQYPLPTYGKYAPISGAGAQNSFVPCVPRAVAAPIPADGRRQAWWAAELSAMKAKGGSPAKQAPALQLGVLAYVNFVNVGYQPTSMRGTVNGQDGTWELDWYAINFGENTGNHLLVLRAPRFIPDPTGISLWDGFLAVFGAVAYLELIGEAIADVIKSILCTPVGRTLTEAAAAAGALYIGTGPQGAALAASGVAAAATALCSGGGPSPPHGPPPGTGNGWLIGGLLALGAAGAAIFAFKKKPR
jgi:hypothetical protein